MPRPPSRIAPEWWDYTTLDAELIRDAAGLASADLVRLSRPGFRVVFYDTLTAVCWERFADGFDRCEPRPYIPCTNPLPAAGLRSWLAA